MPYPMEVSYAYVPYGYMPYAPLPFVPPEHLSAEMSRVSISPSIESQDGDHHDHVVPLSGSHPLHVSAPLFVPSMQHEAVVPVPADLVHQPLFMFYMFKSLAFLLASLLQYH
jgi:hypothetical protein